MLHNYNMQTLVGFIVIIYSMLISLRKKQSSTSILNLTNVVDSAIDESFAESTVSKRFTRKKNSSNEHNRNLRQNKPGDQSINENQSTSKEPLKMGKLSTNIIKAEDLFLRITHTPTKNKNSYAPASSDRATESTYLKSRYETESISLHHPLRKQCPIQLKQQLQLKTNELMILEDEVMRLKRDISCREEDFLKSNIRKEKQFQNEIGRLNQEIKLLKNQLQQKNTQLKQLKKIEAALNREIKSLKYDKVVLEKQIEEIYKKKLPKELKQLMSFRELSLMKQIQDLRMKIQQSKSDNEVKLEAQIQKLKEESNDQSSSVKKLQVHSRILNRKIIEYENDIKQKNQTFSKFYTAMKQSNNDLKQQLKKARKQNLKLKSLHHLNHGHHHRKRNHHMHSSSDESLSLSLSSNN